MSLDVALISNETIRPTSSHLPATFKLSLLDQYTPPIAVPIILFYSSQGANTNMLKKALSETLTHFYPLGGTVRDNHSVDCNDNGVEYLEARIKSRLHQLVVCPEGEKLSQLLPLHWSSSETQVLQIQLNTFECGGIAIAARVSHKVADAATLCSFINTWAAITCGGTKYTPPQFDSAALFPPRDTQVSAFKPPKGGIIIQRIVSRRFVFHSSKLNALKAKSDSKSYVENPTRVEVVSALIWKCLMTSSPLGSIIKLFKVNIAVNLRTRMVPPLSDHSFGNLIIGAMPSSQRDAEFHSLVEKLREAMGKVDGSYLKDLQYDNGVSMFHDSLIKSMELSAKGELGLYTITSWCRFPFYEADFGWGTPIWATSLNVTHKNVVILTDTKYGDGIEALVTLDKDDMAIFASQQELLNFAIPN